jgi:hypothetical protein
MISIEPVGSFNNPEKVDDCVSASQKEKSEIIDSLVRACRKARLDSLITMGYSTFSDGLARNST